MDVGGKRQAPTALVLEKSGHPLRRSLAEHQGRPRMMRKISLSAIVEQTITHKGCSAD